MAVNMQTQAEIAKYKKDLAGCKDKDMLKQASFSCDSTGLRMTLLPSLEATDTATGRVVRTPGSGFNIQFVGGEYHTWSSKQVELIMTSSWGQAGKITPNPRDPDGFWEDLELLKVKTVEVIDVGEQGYVSFEDVDFSKVKAPVKHEKGKEPEPRMIVG